MGCKILVTNCALPTAAHPVPEAAFMDGDEGQHFNPGVIDCAVWNQFSQMDSWHRI